MKNFKDDSGKPRASLAFIDFPLALEALVNVTTMGANKYEAHSWKKVDNLKERYQDARARHFLKSFQEDVDEESKISHLAHEAWNCLALLQVELENKK